MATEAYDRGIPPRIAVNILLANKLEELSRTVDLPITPLASGCQEYGGVVHSEPETPPSTAPRTPPPSNYPWRNIRAGPDGASEGVPSPPSVLGSFRRHYCNVRHEELPKNHPPLTPCQVSGNTSSAAIHHHVPRRASSTPPKLMEEGRTESMTRRTIEEVPSSSKRERTWGRQQLFKKKSQYFGDAFASRESNSTARDRIAKDSMVVAEVTLNFNLESEQTLLSDLSFQLSEIYLRPESCILVAVSSRIPMLLGGNSDPAYIMRICALSSEVSPNKNKRSAALVQDFMLESLQIPQSRGIVCFEGVGEEYMATNGVTTLQEIEEMEKQSRGRDRSRKSTKTQTPTPAERRGVLSDYGGTTRSHLKETSGVSADSKSTDGSGPSRKRMKSRHGLMSIFGSAKAIQ